METLSLYLLKSIVVSGLLTGWYLLGLRGKRLHQYNRFFLLLTLAASLTIPFFHFQLFSIPKTVTSSFAAVSLLLPSEVETDSTIQSVEQTVQTQIDWKNIAGIAAAGVSIMLLVVLSVRIYKVQRMSRQYPVTKLEGVNLIETDSPRAPFTFLKWLFWNRSISLQGEVGQLIFRHELAHIKQRHTYDKLACQVLTCIFWFNPFYWIIQKELNLIHEFVADEHAVSDHDSEAFAMMLLRTYSNGSYLVPEHHFFSSNVKRRLAMLQNMTMPSYATIRRWMAVPLVAGVVLLFSCSRDKALETTVVPAKKKIVVLLDAAHGGVEIGGQANGFTEKEICLKYAKRIQELSPAYNVEVKLTRNDDRQIPLEDRVAVSNKMKPDVFISLHVGEEPGKEKGKGDFDIYIAKGNAQADKSNNYSSAIFQSMEEHGVIPGVPASCSHNPSQACASCRNANMQNGVSSTAKDGVYVLKYAEVPSMVVNLGNIKNQEGMQQLTSDEQLNILSNAMLKGIVEGAAEKKQVAGCATPATWIGNVNSGLPVLK